MTGEELMFKTIIELAIEKIHFKKTRWILFFDITECNYLVLNTESLN